MHHIWIIGVGSKRSVNGYNSLLVLILVTVLVYLEVLSNFAAQTSSLLEACSRLATTQIADQWNLDIHGYCNVQLSLL